MTVGSLLPLTMQSVIIREIIQIKDLMNVRNVASPLQQSLTSLHTGEFTLEKNLTDVLNVENLFHMSLAFIIIRLFTLG